MNDLGDTFLKKEYIPVHQFYFYHIFDLGMLSLFLPRTMKNV